MKLVLSTIVVGIVLFLLGWVVYGMILMDFFKKYYGHIWRSEEDYKIWAFAIANFAQAFFMYLIYSKGYSGGSPLTEGLRFGVLIGLFVTIPYILYTWGGMTVGYVGVIVDGIISFIFIVIAAVITAYIHGRREVKPASV